MLPQTLVSNCRPGATSVDLGTITSFNVLLIPTIAYLSICKPLGISYYCAVGYAILGAVLSVSPVAYLLWLLGIKFAFLGTICRV